MSNKYVIRQKLDKRKFRYYSANGMTGWDHRISESLVYDLREDAVEDAIPMKENFDGIEVIAVKVTITPIRAREE
jgi:hypothetical protein